MAVYKNHNFFDMLEKGAGFALKAAKSLRELFNRIMPEEQAAAVKMAKQDADKHMHMIRDYLGEAFITPIDRDDIYRIAKETDKITESIDSAAGMLRMMNVTYTGVSMKIAADYIVKACEKLAELMPEIKNHKKKNKICGRAAEINEIKEAGSKCCEDAVRDLFMRERDPIELIKMKEIYGGLKDVLLNCENAADCVQAIIITKT
jgi:uncharacterized protein